MRYLKDIAYFVIMFAVIQILAPENAYAYLDPGAGSYIYQVMIAFIVGLVFTFKQFYSRLKGLLTQAVLWGRRK